MDKKFFKHRPNHERHIDGKWTVICDICGREAPQRTAAIGQLDYEFYGGSGAISITLCNDCYKKGGMLLSIAHSQYWSMAYGAEERREKLFREDCEIAGESKVRQA